jgi:glycosyltransferase involved in cell wall biosynthesis
VDTVARKINVLFLQSQAYFGADSLIHAQLMRHLDRERFSVHVACTVGDGSGKPASLAALEQIPGLHLRPARFAPGFHHRTLAEVRRGVLASARSPFDFAALAAYAKKHRVDIIHGTEKPRDAAYAVALGKLTGARSAVHVHVKWSDEYPATARWAVRHADAVMSISAYVTDTIAGMGVPRDRIHTVLNALDASGWDPMLDGGAVRRELGIAEDAPVLASISRLFRWKGPAELIRALAIARERVPDIRLLIVGEDETFIHGGSYSAELKALAGQLGLWEHVIFTGFRRDVPAVMAACDVFAMPSFEEPFGVVFLEAMAMRKPVIALDNGGTPQVVDHGRAGLLSPPGDIEALAANIVALARDPALRCRMGEYGRARVLDYFTPQRMAREMEDAYRAVLQRGSGRY